VPMVGLFLAAFSLTWALGPAPGQADTMSKIDPVAFAASSSSQAPGAAAELQPGASSEPVSPAEQREPTLYELAVDSDPGTREEAQALLGLLDEEQNVD
jgi:hypothetical protein